MFERDRVAEYPYLELEYDLTPEGGKRRIEEKFRKARARYKGRLGQLRGEHTEQLFLLAWEDRSQYPPWLMSVRKATKREDHDEATDAVMKTIEGDSLRVQIKSHVLSQRLSDSLISLHRGVVPLHVGVTHDLETIRSNTLLAIAHYYVRRGELPTQPPVHRTCHSRLTLAKSKQMNRVRRIASWDVPDPSEFDF